ncbi:MAG: gamma-glutamylcyclotransferase family protein [Candidatus Rokuibacteriota bacterium]
MRAQRARRALLFAYGTLMRGYPLHRVLAPRATLVGRGTVGGTLLDLGRYPGLTAGRGRVRGELYRLDDAELLGTLDREEGYHFRRSRGVVTLARGRRVRAWLYRYRGPLPPRAVAIPQGDYRRVRWR